jgi:hypothetical protein
VGDGDNWKYRLRVKVLRAMIWSSRPLIRHLHKRKYMLMAGVVNTEEDLKLMREQYGELVDIIITDRPGLVNEYLAKSQ